MICKDCYHYGVCKMYGAFHIKGRISSKWKNCPFRKDKAKYIELPCKVGETVYCFDDIVNNELCADCEYYYEGGMGDYPSCQKTRYGFRPAKCIEIIEIVADKDFVLKYYKEFGEKIFLTKEKAESKLKELNNDEKY